MSRHLPHLSTEAPDSYDGLCGFRTGAKPDHAPACLTDAAWHGIVLTDDGTGIVTLLSSCSDHKAAMALTADLIHEMTTACPLDESTIWWDGPSGTSGCRIDWDTSHLAIALSQPVTG